MEEKVSVAKFFNLLKQYWTSNPDKTFQEIWLTLLDINTDEDRELVSKVRNMILPEKEAYNKLLNLCKENNTIDDFFNKFK